MFRHKSQWLVGHFSTIAVSVLAQWPKCPDYVRSDCLCIRTEMSRCRSVSSPCPYAGDCLPARRTVTAAGPVFKGSILRVSSYHCRRRRSSSSSSSRPETGADSGERWWPHQQTVSPLTAASVAQHGVTSVPRPAHTLPARPLTRVGNNLPATNPTQQWSLLPDCQTALADFLITRCILFPDILLFEAK